MDSNIAVAIVLTAMFIAIGVGGAVHEYAEGQVKIEAIKAGLQECPIRPDSYNTVWQKECK